MSDVLQHGHRFRALNVLDDYNREILGIDMNSGVPASRVVRYLDQIAVWRRCLQKVCVGNGPEFISSEFAAWVDRKNIRIDYIQSGCPYQNGYIERFNRTGRGGVQGMYLFGNQNEVRYITDDWIRLI